MAKKIKFPLTMKNDVKVRTIEDLREYFDLEKVVEYFLDGKLLAWLDARYYEKESDAIQSLQKDDEKLQQKLCNIFDVEYDGKTLSSVNLENILEHNRRLNELKQFTSDATILNQINQVAFNQEELARLLDDGIHDIYLFNNSFTIPLQKKNRHYIGIGNTEVVIPSQEKVDFQAKGIQFDNIHFDALYEKIHNAPSQKKDDTCIYNQPVCRVNSPVQMIGQSEDTNTEYTKEEKGQGVIEIPFWMRRKNEDTSTEYKKDEKDQSVIDIPVWMRRK